MKGYDFFKDSLKEKCNVQFDSKSFESYASSLFEIIGPEIINRNNGNDFNEDILRAHLSIDGAEDGSIEIKWNGEKLIVVGPPNVKLSDEHS